MPAAPFAGALRTNCSRWAETGATSGPCSRHRLIRSRGWRDLICSAIAAAAATAATSAAAATTTAAAATATTAAAGAFLRDVHLQGPPVERLPVECCDRRLGF